MSIPEEAVEAAANDLYDREGYSTTLADAPQYRKDRFRTLAREVLEAAAPILVEALASEAFKDKKIQGLQRVLIGNWLRARA